MENLDNVIQRLHIWFQNSYPNSDFYSQHYGEWLEQEYADLLYRMNLMEDNAEVLRK
jgi:hypothetical protein